MFFAAFLKLPIPFRHLVEIYLNETENSVEFAKWAFGEDFLEIARGEGFLEAWNILHGDVLYLEISGRLNLDIPKMIQLWRESKSE